VNLIDAKQRDYLYAAPPPVLSALPARGDLCSQFPPDYDQGALGSCAANAIAGAIEFDQMKQRLADEFTPARLFIYYNERVESSRYNSQDPCRP